MTKHVIKQQYRPVRGENTASYATQRKTDGRTERGGFARDLRGNDHETDGRTDTRYAESGENRPRLYLETAARCFQSTDYAVVNIIAPTRTRVAAGTR